MTQHALSRQSPAEIYPLPPNPQSLDILQFVCSDTVWLSVCVILGKKETFLFFYGVKNMIRGRLSGGCLFRVYLSWQVLVKEFITIMSEYKTQKSGQKCYNQPHIHTRVLLCPSFFTGYYLLNTLIPFFPAALTNE